MRKEGGWGRGKSDRVQKGDKDRGKGEGGKRFSPSPVNIDSVPVQAWQLRSGR